MTARDDCIDEVSRYYGQKIEEHGATPKGVDWRDQASQEARFRQLALVMGNDTAGSVIDIGCGYGAMAPFLRNLGWTGHFEGVDISSVMIQAAAQQLREDPNVTLTVGRVPSEPADYVFASGIFNVRMTTELSVWEEHLFRTIDEIVSWARKGVAFNFLTSWSDRPRMRADLYYASPEKVLEYCARNHSRWLEISQDYGLFEFTMRLGLDRPAARLRIQR